eukprot:symbB.v1.2.014123.t1/scaffold1002.1/size145525/5
MPTMQEASDEETDLNHTNTATAPQQSGQEEDPLEKSDDFEDEFEAGSDHTASGGLPDAEDAEVADVADVAEDAEVADDAEVLDDFDAEDQVERIESDPDPPVVVMEGDEIDHNSVPSIKSDPDRNLVDKAPSEEIAQALSEHMRTVAASNESESDKVVVNDRNEVNETNDEEIAQALSEHMRTVAASNESESDKVVVNDRNEVNETNEDIAVDKKVSEIDEINEVNEENEVSHDYTDFEADSQSPSKKEALPSESGVGLAGDISGGISASASPSSIGIGGAVAGPGPPRGMSQGRGWSEDFEDDDGINEDQELTNERAWDPEGSEDGIREDSGESLNFVG